MALDLSCAFATSLKSHEHARIAEDLGYKRAWFYDSPALYPDVWVQLCRAAERTQRIGLGPGVLVPSLRHPMVNAAAIATLVSIAGPGRVAIGVGAGFTGRLTMGQRPMKWSDVRQYLRVLRALLRGEEAEWEGGAMRMLHPQGYGASCPIDVPFVIGAAGPKGIAVAHELGDGVFGAGTPIRGFQWENIVLTFGTLVAEGEDQDLLARKCTPPATRLQSCFTARWRTGGWIWFSAASNGPRPTRQFPSASGISLFMTSILSRSTIATGHSSPARWSLNTALR